jgi:3-oxocholest-4-en-26-oate---CoA ligase
MGARGWSFAAVWQDHARRFPDAPALRHGGRTWTWAEFAERSARLAGSFAALGVAPGTRVAVLAHNRPEYLEVVHALSLGGGVHANTNHRYTAEEVADLWRSLAVRVAVVEPSLEQIARGAAEAAGGVDVVVLGDDGPGSYEDLVRRGRPVAGDERDGSEELLICTGGTTGRPKGVVWRATDLFLALRGRSFGSAAPRVGEDLDLPLVRELVIEPGLRGVPLAPLMHGTGLVNAMSWLFGAGCVVTDPASRFDAVQALDLLARERIQAAALVGDAFARPMLERLEAEPARWDLSAMLRITSAGVMWSESVKAGLLTHLPNAELVDSLGASEAMGMASTTARRGEMPPTGTFTLAASSLVVDEAGRPVALERGVRGRLAMGGAIPLGYASAAGVDDGGGTFFVRDGSRYVAPGDMVEVVEGRTVRLLGRGSSCINTGGEKVYAEEVEEALKAVRGVTDAAVIGLPHERFGSQVAALVATAEPLSTDDVVGDLRAHLAGYKLPRVLRFATEVPRANNGKVDLVKVRALLDEP